MLRVGVITLFPEMLSALTEYGVSGRAVKNDLLQVLTFNPREFTKDVHRTVDDRPYGGGPGMVMMLEPLRDAIEMARKEIADARVIYLSPQGKRLDQKAVVNLANEKNLILLSGRYEGIDERIINTEVDEEWSIGDYVVSGGELPAMVLIDAMVRTVPGVLGHEDSASEDSFFNGILDYPHYTRPEKVAGLAVPEILLGGNHAEIGCWRMKQALGRTWQRRPDLLDNMQLDDEQQALLDEFIREQKET